MIIPRDRFDAAYDLLRRTTSMTSCSLLVLCASDVDSLCCLHILTTLLQAEDIAYRKKSVSSQEDLEQANQDIQTSAVELNAIILINCGGGMNLREVLNNAPEAAVIYVVDSHRPYHFENIKDDHKVILFGEENTEDMGTVSIPETKNHESDEETFGDPHSAPTKKRKISQEKSGSFYGPSAALIAYRIAEAVRREKDSNILWWTIVGCTDQFVHRRIDATIFDDMVRDFRLELTGSADAEEDNPDYTPSIVYSKELKLVLLRHWTLYDSLYHSPLFATKLGIWRPNGKHQLNMLLAKMGVALVQSQQSFSGMASELKQLIPEKLCEYVPESMKNDLFVSSFEKEFSCPRRVRLTASDIVYAATSLVESGQEDSFWSAYDAISGDKKYMELTLTGIEKAIQMQRDIVAQAAGMLSIHAIVLTGPLRYAILNESSLLPRFVYPLALSKLAHFVMDAISEVRPGKKPFILCALNEKTNSYLTVAVANDPLSSSNKNAFGHLFEKAARNTKSRITHHGFDSAVVEIQKEDLAKFIESIHADLLFDDSQEETNY